MFWWFFFSVCFVIFSQQDQSFVKLKPYNFTIIFIQTHHIISKNTLEIVSNTPHFPLLHSFVFSNSQRWEHVSKRKFLQHHILEMHPLSYNSFLYYSTIQIFHLFCFIPEQEVISVRSCFFFFWGGFMASHNRK